jgi:hypothetical protein
MTILVGFLISFAAGWSIAACEAVFRSAERPGLFRGTGGIVLLLVVAGIGGFTIAGALVWLFQALISAAVLVIIAGGMVLGGMASRKLHVNAAGAANRMMLGLGVLVLLYALVWTVMRPDRSPEVLPPPAASPPTSK